MRYEDKTLICMDCGQPFTFSADDQAFHTAKGFTNEPKRCASCREARRSERHGGYDQDFREMHPVTCTECGKDTTVPFRPRGDRPDGHLHSCSREFDQNKRHDIVDRDDPGQVERWMSSK